MGGGRDKRKKAKEKKDGPLAGKGVAKTDKKTELNEAKKERRAVTKLAGNEDDIDAIFAKFAIDSEKGDQQVTIEADCPPPSPRVNASFIPYIAPVSLLACMHACMQRGRCGSKQALRSPPLLCSGSMRSSCLAGSASTPSQGRCGSSMTCTATTWTGTNGHECPRPTG